jgi:ribosomal protein S18 acetylase RimI-like enzyme
MVVRPMRERELDEVVAIWHESRKATHTSLGIAGERGLTLRDSSRIFGEGILPRCRIWVAQREAGLVGFLAIRGSTVDRMYVRPGAQRAGVGTALLGKARELSPDGLELHTHQSNEGARRFYEKHGFRAVAFGTSPPPENEPDVEYRWRPDPR